MVRILAVIEEDISKETKIRGDLMSGEFPSIWMEINRMKKSSESKWVITTSSKIGGKSPKSSSG